MIRTLNKHVKWRNDNKAIFICDCKRLIDLKIPFEYEEFMIKLFSGIDKEKLNETDKKVFSDFEKMELLSKLELKQLEEKDFQKAMDILDNELGKDRVRDPSFLFEKFKEFYQFFIGLFLDNEILGVICGFSREDYLLISEIAVDSRFSRRGFGRKLVEKFEEIAHLNNYKKINVGALDNSIYFYVSLRYKPFLLVQFKENIYSKDDFKNFKIMKSDKKSVEIDVEKADIKILEGLRKKYPQANFQYIFTKKV